MTSLDALLDDLAERIAEKLRENEPAPTTTRLVTVADAAAYLGRSKPAIHRLIASKRLPVVRADRRLFLDRHDLDEFIAVHKQH